MGSSNEVWVWVLVCLSMAVVSLIWIKALLEDRYLARYTDSRGCFLWEIDTGESVWVAAKSRLEAIAWYAREGDYDPGWDEDLNDCCSRKPCLLSALHYRELGAPSEGKETYGESMEHHHARGGPVPFMVSTTMG